MLDLQPGDRVSWGFTTEVMVDGDKTWPKMEINSAVQEGETAEQAITRVTNVVNEHFEKSVNKTAEMLMAANRRQRR